METTIEPDREERAPSMTLAEGAAGQLVATFEMASTNGPDGWFIVIKVYTNSSQMLTQRTAINNNLADVSWLGKKQ